MKKEFFLSALRKVRSSSLVEDGAQKANEMDEFFLVLAIIFNDIKGLVFFDKWMHDYKIPDVGEISGHAGEWNGLRLQLIKLLASVLYESLEFISQHKDLIIDRRFDLYVSRLSNQNKNVWNLVLEAIGIRGAPSIGTQYKIFKNLLLQIRNNISFHYYQAGKPLTQGFKTHFFGQQLKGEPAYYSSTQTDLFQTRYYFADAALEGYITNSINVVGNVDEVIKAINELSVAISKVIVGLLEQYLKTKPSI